MAQCAQQLFFSISVKLPPLPIPHGHPESVVSGPRTSADKAAGAITAPPQRASAAACGARSRRFPACGPVRISKKWRGGGGEGHLGTVGGPKRGAGARVVVFLVPLKLRKEKLWKMLGTEVI
jgi:hypothetical protein